MSSEAASRLPSAGRLHPWTLVFDLFAVARQMLIPLIYWVVSGFNMFGTLLVVIFGVPNLLLVIIRYWTFHYRVEQGELIVEQGILRRQERHIPLANIQEIRLEQNLIQRQLGIARADIETSTGGGVEASLALLSVQDIAGLRQCVFEHRGEDVPRTEARTVAEVPLVSLGWQELLIAGLTSNSIFTLFIILGALLRSAEEWLPEAGRRIVLRGIETTVYALGGQSTARLLVTLFLSGMFLVLLSAVISSVMTLVRFYGFRLVEQGADLRRTYGLLTRHVSSLSPARIQLLAIEQTLLQRLFGWAVLRVDVAGVTYERREEQQGRGVLVPLIRPSAAEALLSRFMPDYVIEPQGWRKVSPLAVRRGILRRTVWLVVLTALALWWWSWPYGLWTLLGFPVIVVVSWLDYRRRGYITGTAYWFVRQGWAGHRVYAIPVSNIQAVVVAQTPFDLRLGLASLILDTAGQTPIIIPDLPVAEAYTLGRQLAQHIEKPSSDQATAQ
ncbi:MAG: PH domain-containing protein [Acidobacteriota bacterium]